MRDDDWFESFGIAIWRHLANTIESSVCGDDAALRQITLTTCADCFECTSVGAVKADDGAVNSFSHPLAGLSGKRSSRSDSSGMLRSSYFNSFCFMVSLL